MFFDYTYVYRARVLNDVDCSDGKNGIHKDDKINVVQRAIEEIYKGFT